MKLTDYNELINSIGNEMRTPHLLEDSLDRIDTITDPYFKRTLKELSRMVDKVLLEDSVNVLYTPDTIVISNVLNIDPLKFTSDMVYELFRKNESFFMTVMGIIFKNKGVEFRYQISNDNPRSDQDIYNVYT